MSSLEIFSSGSMAFDSDVLDLLLSFLLVELVEPPESAPVSERISFPGFSGDPDSLLNAKSKIWEKLHADLLSDGQLIACYKNVPFTTTTGVCRVKSIANGEIR